MPVSKLEVIANEFVHSHLRRNPGLELVQVHCAVDKRQTQHASAEDVRAFMKSLAQDTSIRFDVSDDEVEDEIVHARPVPEPETVDIDMDAKAESTILVRCLGKHRRVYFAGFHQRSKRVLFTTDPMLAHRFESDREVLEIVFQFQDAGDLVLKDVFESLGLTLTAPPPTPSF